MFINYLNIGMQNTDPGTSNFHQEAEEEIFSDENINALGDNDYYYSYDEDEDNNSDNEGSNFDENDDLDETDQIREWAIQGNISRILITQLLLILRRRLLPNLPKTAATFLKSQHNFNVVNVDVDK